MMLVTKLLKNWQFKTTSHGYDASKAAKFSRNCALNANLKVLQIKFFLIMVLFFSKEVYYMSQLLLDEYL